MKAILYIGIIALCAYVLMTKWNQAQSEKARAAAEQLAAERKAAAATPTPEPMRSNTPLSSGAFTDRGSRSTGMPTGSTKEKVRDTRDILPWKNKPDNLGKGGTLDQRPK